MSQDPFQELKRLQQRMKQILEQSSQSGGDHEEGVPPSPAQPWSPAVDILESEAELIVQADLPEVGRQDVHLQLTGNVLTLSGERKRAAEHKSRAVRRERPWGPFLRHFSLPGHFEAQGISAQLRNGVLTIRLSKKDQPAPRRIQIT